VHQDIQEELIREMSKASVRFFGQNAIESPDYPKIINQTNFDRLHQLMQYGKVLSGGQSDEQKLRIAPTILADPNLDSPLMNDEIFGPLLPIIPYQNLEEAVQFVQNKPNPLALYIFSSDKTFQQAIRDQVQAGGVTINDTLMHFTNSSLPFGGIGASGFGNYHGKAGFDAFSHQQSVMKRATWIDVPVRYPPYGQKIKLLKRLMK
jgi:acyl-CoA reductase-like NAD-dependent aldehyde dehydrogenase